MSRRGRPGHDLSAVVEAGARVFTRHGYDASTMDDVAAALGIAKSSLYHHVASKEEILARTLDRALGALERAFDTAEQSGGAESRLERLVRAAVGTLIEELPSVTLLLRVRGNSIVEREAMERRRALDARLAAAVTQAQQADALVADIDPHVAARLIFGMVNSISEWYRPGAATGLDAAHLADAVCALLMDAAPAGL